MAAFLFFILLTGWIIQPGSIIDMDNNHIESLSAPQSVSASKPVSVPQPISNNSLSPATTSYIELTLDDSTGMVYLSIKSASIKQALDKIAEQMKFDVITTKDGEKSLQQIVNLKTKGDLDTVIQALLGEITYKIITLEDPDNKNNKTFYCIGKNACADIQPLLQLSDNEQKDPYASVSPSEAFQQALTMEISPDSRVDTSSNKMIELVEKIATLKQEFRYANSNTKIQILNTLDATTDLDFFIDALNHEQNTQVRQAAARGLFLPQNKQAMTALLSVLNDTDEILVITALNLISETHDEELRYQASRLLANHPNNAIKSSLQDLGYEAF